MTGAGPPSLPASHVLAQWWQELAPRQPRRLWFSRLLLHRLEVLVETSRPCPLDSLTQALLNQLCRTSPSSAAALEALRLERSLLLVHLRDLSRRGLAEKVAGAWQPTPAGREAAATGRCRHRERRNLYFVDNAEHQRPPHFLALAHARPRAVVPAAGWSFDIQLLQRCLALDTGWKTRHHFPEDVLALAEPARPDDWRAVRVDFAEELTLALVEVPGPALLGFAGEPPEWQAPVVELRDWGEVFPDLSRDPGADDWRAAWRDWCEPLHLPAMEVLACRCERADHQVRVTAPLQLVKRFQGGPAGEKLACEPWLLAGSGRSREAAQLELLEDPGRQAG